MTWAVCPGVRYAATSRYESRHKKVVESMAVKQRFRRHVVWILTLLIMLSFSIATSAEDVTQKRSNVSESTETERYQVVVPTDVDGMFDFILDPQGLINETNAAMYDGESFEADSTVFFKRTDGRVETDYSSKSDFFTIINRSTVPINITLELKMKEESLGGIIMTSDKEFVDDKNASLYLALMDDSNEYSIGREGVTIDVTIGAAANDTDFNGYSFQLTGAANKAGDWSSLTKIAPEVILTWSISSGEKTELFESGALDEQENSDIEQENLDIEQEKDDIVDQDESVSENVDLDKDDVSDKDSQYISFK